MSLFDETNELCRSRLGFNIGGDASTFRSVIDRCGQERVYHCITLTRLWAKPWHSGRQKYDRLLALLLLIAPDNVPPQQWRDAKVRRGMERSGALSAELGDILRRDDQA